MFAMVPLICFYFIYQNFLNRPMQGEELLGRREAVLVAAVIGGILLVAITEILSFFKLLTFGWVLASWCALTLIFCLLYFYKRKRMEAKASVNAKLPFFLKVLIGYAAFIVIVSGVIAVIAPPNNWDSLIYHMSRVAHWVQNRSVAYFPTHNLMYLMANPFAEFSILHFQILSGGDRFANLVQWMSLIGCLIGVSLIAMRLGAKERGQVFSAILCATIPIGILQAPSTQNNFVMSFWLVCFAYFILSLNTSGINRLRLFCAGMSLGLAEKDNERVCPVYGSLCRGAREMEGVDILVDAATGLPEAQFVIAGGNDDEVKNWKERLAQKKIVNVIFLGRIQHSDLVSLCQAADIVVYPHRSGGPATHTSPLKFFEYLASGTPIVAADIPFLAEFRDKGLALEICAPDSVEAFAAAFKNALNRYPRRTDGYSANISFARQFTWEERMSKIFKCIEGSTAPEKNQ